MKQSLLFFLKHYLFWVLIFIGFRILFLFSQSQSLGDTPLTEIAFSLLAGFQLDISTASYFAIIPFLLTIALIWGGDRIIFNILKVYYLLILFITMILSIGNIIIYKYWGTLLNSRGLAYALQPAEMLASVTDFQLVSGIIVLIILFFLMRKAYYFYLHPALAEINGTRLQRLASVCIALPLIVIGIRGGLQLIPVNESAAVFSSNKLLNEAATNNLWYLGHNLKQAGTTNKNPYQWFSDEESIQVVASLYAKKSVPDSIFNMNHKPNVVLILLESWTADIIEPLGGIAGVTPNFSKLCKEGMLFSAIYSSGFRTDQALVSALSGYPSQPNNSIIRFPSKASQLPSIANVFNENGYQTSFYYGGELGFANMYNYLSVTGFKTITGKEAFEDDVMNSKWGAHDEAVLDRQLSDLKKAQQPFFSTLLTLSTHEPFEVPVNTPFNDPSEPELFKKSAWYTDYCLGKYFEQAKNESWFTNTIFVLVADHGHRLPLNRSFDDPFIRRIPMLIIGNPLRKELKGTQINVIGNQNDLPATLLSALNYNHNEFPWSRDLMVPSQNPFAYLSLDYAISWVHQKGNTVVRLDSKQESISADSTENRIAKAYLQQLYKSFLSF
ncbi:MAG: sulfatase-like hydrolase/transferase [Bacteroidetes bacterium]|nr:sulfatase-like hydrolase/transferase [Bacteroidota bacterium]